MIMKNLFKSMLPVVAASLFVWGCEKDENMVMFETGTNPVLSASTLAPQLIPGKEKEVAMTLNWTNPEYTFNTGISSQDVQYRLEFDTVGANFGNARKGIVVVARDLSRSFTVEQMNALFSGADGMRLPFDRDYNMEVRAISTIGTTALPLISNVLRFRVRPFSPPPVVVVPDAGTLWTVGDAFASGWNNMLPAPNDVRQQFTRRSNTLYELTVDMPGGGAYKLIQQLGNWSTQYTLKEGTWDKGTFKKQDADPGFSGPPTAGKYKITVNFQDGVYSVVKQ
jgi:starch-binding outer membrane protein SusE/F